MPASYGQLLKEELNYKDSSYVDHSLNSIFPAVVGGELSLDANMYSDESNCENSSPHLRIVVEPVDKFRYRYKSEKGFHGAIHGNTTVLSKRSCPVVQLENFTPDRSVPIIVKVNLFTDELNPKPHVLDLIGKTCENGVSYAMLTKDKKASFPSIAIGHKKREEVKEELMKKEISKYKSKKQKFDEKKTEADIKEFIKNINLKSSRLGFQAFYKDDLNHPLCDMVFSQAIVDSRGVSSGDMNIIRISSCTGRCTGGEEIILLCDKIKKDDIEVRFYEKEGNLVGCGEFSQADVHHQVAITFKTPSYKKNIDSIVQICLYQPSDEKCGPPRDFRYIVDENETSRKRRRRNSDDLPVDNLIKIPQTLYVSSLCQEENIHQDEDFDTLQDLESILMANIDPALLQGSDADINSLLESFEIDDTSQSLNVDSISQKECAPTICLTSKEGSILEYLGFPSITSATTPVLKIIKSAADKVQSAATYLKPTTGDLKIDAACGQMRETSSHSKSFKSSGKVWTKIDDPAGKPGFTYYRLMEDTVVGEMGSERHFSESAKTPANRDTDKRGDWTTPFRNPTFRKERGSSESQHKLGTLRKNICELLKIEVDRTWKYDVPSLIYARDKNGNNSLHLAVLKGEQNGDLLMNLLNADQENTVNRQIRLKQKVNIFDVVQGSVNHKNKFQETPLHLAVQKNYVRHVGALLRFGADLKSVNGNGDNCFHLAAKKNFFSCMDPLLITLMMRTRTMNHSSNINALNYDGLSPLHLSIMNNSKECMQLLLAKTADVNISEKKCGRSPLHLAIEFQPAFISNLLMKKNLDLDTVDFRGHTPLQSACDINGLSFERVTKEVGDDAKSIAQFLKSLNNENVIQRWKLTKDELKETDNSPSDDSDSDQNEPDGNLSSLHECVEKKLCKLLDNSDWRKLGKAIGLTEVELDRIAVLDAGLSPTRTVLKQIKEVYAGQNLKTVLLEVLVIAGLPRAAKLMQDNG